MTASSKDLSLIKNELKELKKEIDMLKKRLGEKKPKKPRKPSLFNQFMKKEIPRIKKLNPSMDHPTAFKEAAANWKKQKQ